jgi:hypothetical protein
MLLKFVFTEFLFLGILSMGFLEFFFLKAGLNVNSSREEYVSCLITNPMNPIFRVL